MNQVLLSTDADIVTLVFERLDQRASTAGAAGGLRPARSMPSSPRWPRRVQGAARTRRARSVRDGYEAVA